MKLILMITILAIGLWFDQTVDFWGQFLTNIGVWLFFLFLVKQATNQQQQASLIACLLYATVGEVCLSLIWGLYEYRLHNVPLFVPPGHVLLFSIGLLTANKMPNWIIWGVPLVMLPYVIWAYLTNVDTFGTLLFVIFLGCLIWGREKKLYATMFVLSLILEIYGTALGNWMWLSEVPWTFFTSTNPPFCAGTFYCLLDLLVVVTVNRESMSNLLRICSKSET